MATTTGLSVFGKKTTTSTQKTYPKLPDPDGSFSRMVDERRKYKVEFDQSKGELTQVDGVLKDAAFEEWVRSNEDKDMTDDTLQIDGKSGAVKVSVKSQYWDITLNDEDPKSVDRELRIKKLLGMAHDRFVTKKFKLEVDGSAVPEANRDSFLSDFAQLLERYGADPSAAVKAKEVLAMNKKFHAERHSILSQEENKAFHDLWACAVGIR